MRYYYSKLDEAGKLAYKEIYHSIENLEDRVNIKLKNADGEKVRDLYEKVILDNPMLFYVNPYIVSVIHSGISRYSLVFSYLHNKRKIEAIKREIEKKVKDIEKKILSYDTKIERERYIHRYIMSNMDYDHDIDYQKDMICHTIEGVLIYKKAVCDGISKLFKLLCDIAKINCLVIVGNSWNQYEPPQRHAWNMIKINGNWHYVDMTWDLNLSKRFEYVRYDYFNLREADIRKDHADFPKLEICNSFEDNYFYENNCIVDGEKELEEFVCRKMAEVLKSGKKTGYINMRFYNDTSEDTVDLIFSKVTKALNRCIFHRGSVKYSLCPNNTQDVYVLIIEM